MAPIISTIPQGRTWGRGLAGWTTVAILIALSIGVCSSRRPRSTGAAARLNTAASLDKAFAALPLSFEPNVGQFASGVRFAAHGASFALLLRNNGLVIQTVHGSPSIPVTPGFRLPPRSAAPAIHRPTLNRTLIKFEGANPQPRLAGVDRLAATSNYFLGEDPARWRRAIPNYGRVSYQSIYPGIDAIFYGRKGRLEYDLTVAPGGNPAVIRMRIVGAGQLAINQTGDLVLHSRNSQITLGRPIAYQRADHRRIPVKAAYRLADASTATIAVGDYDHSRPLVLDPAIMFSTYLGGTAAAATAVAVDSNNEAFVTGWTCCVSDFPTTAPYQSALAGIDNIFVAKFSADGQSLIYSTYLGGSGSDFATGIALDSAGDAYVAGYTNSPDFPVSPVNDSELAGGDDAFVAVLNPTGSGLVYSRYLGGGAYDAASSIAVDSDGSAYLGGRTFSSDFPTTPGAFQSSNPSAGVVSAGFLTRIDPPVSTGDAPTIAYSTYFGGPAPAGAVMFTGVALGGPTGNVYAVGGGDSGAPTTTGRGFGGTFDAVVANFDTTQSAAASLLFSEFIGGSGFDLATSVATQSGCTSNCPAFIAGYTFSADLGQLGAHAQPGGLEDGFVTEVDSHGGLNYLNYLGGSGFDELRAAAVDSKGSELVAGLTTHPAQVVGPFSEVLQGPPKPAGMLFASGDGGASFAATSWPGALAGSISLNGLVIDKSVSPALVYAATDQGVLWLSTDAGTSFQPLAISTAQISAIGLQNSFGAGPRAIFAAVGSGIWVSGDGGATFVQLGTIPVAGPVNVYFIAADNTAALEGSTTNYYVWLGTDHGFFTSTDNGSSFTAATGLASGSQVTQVFSGVRDTADNLLYAGTDKGVFVSSNNGVSFTPTNLNYDAVISMAIDPTTTPPTIYAATFGDGVIASTDGFKQNLTVAQGLPPGRINSVAVDDQTKDPATVYVGQGSDRAIGSIWESTDAGHSYSQLDANNFNPPCCVFPIAVNAGTIFAGNYLGDDGVVAKMNTTGLYALAWSNLGGAGHDQLNAIAVDSADNAYVAGLTYSKDFPTRSPLQATLGASTAGAVNATLAKIAFTSKAIIKERLLLNFGTHVLRAPGRPKTVIIHNRSRKGTLTLGYVRVSGNDAGDFQIVSGASADARQSAKHGIPACGITLPPNSRCAVRIVFKPLAIGTRAAALLVPNDASNGTVATILIGKGRRLRGPR